MMELAGLAALLSVFVEILKKFGVIPDGWGGIIATVIQVVVFAVAAIGTYLGWDLVQLDSFFAMLAELLGMILVGFVTHKVGRAMTIW